ncbi:MAG: hypothetical protein C4522_04035 [Desulfobacteraceae bacterium]|nr:MAG: hypothetical protein C4522_04035 [Desulfobacteraceae bacterium]
MTNKRNITIGYIFFYLLFSVDTWRILLGILISILLTPQLLKTNPMTGSGEIMLYIMLAGIGWAITAYPAKSIALFLRKVILNGKQ